MQHHPIEIHKVSKKEQGLARESFDILGELVRKNKPTYLSLNNEKHELPEAAAKLLVEILNQMVQGNALTLIPRHANLTTQEAADLLNVSRPYLVKLLDDGYIPFFKVGNRRKVLADDVMSYKEKITQERHKTLQELVDQAQELNLGYDE